MIDIDFVTALHRPLGVSIVFSLPAFVSFRVDDFAVVMPHGNFGGSDEQPLFDDINLHFGTMWVKHDVSSRISSSITPLISLTFHQTVAHGCTDIRVR